MPFPARGENVKLGKGSLLLALQDAVGAESGFDFVGNANSISISSDITQVQLFSSTEKSGALIDRARTRIAYLLTASLNEFAKRNLEYFLAGESVSKSQTVQTNQAVVIANVTQGRYYDLGYRQVTGVVVVKTPGSIPLVLGTDYTLNAEFGVIGIIAGGGIADLDDLSVELDAPALTITQIRLATAGSKIAHLLYLADDANNSGAAAKDRLEVWKVDVAPDGELNLISDDYGAFSLTMAVLNDGTNHPNDPYGTLDRIEA